MEIQRQKIEHQEDAQKAKQMEYVESINNCPLCGSTLNLAHEFDYLAGEVHEDAHCPSCQIRTRRMSFTVH